MDRCSPCAHESHDPTWRERGYGTAMLVRVYTGVLLEAPKMAGVPMIPRCNLEKETIRTNTPKGPARLYWALGNGGRSPD